MIHLVERHGPQETEKTEYAGVAELADAQASGACGRKIVWVQVPFPAFFFILSKIKKTEAPNTGTSVFLFIFLFQKRSRSRPREAHL